MQMPTVPSNFVASVVVLYTFTREIFNSKVTLFVKMNLLYILQVNYVYISWLVSPYCTFEITINADQEFGITLHTNMFDEQSFNVDV